jgi:hypothetical protein
VSDLPRFPCPKCNRKLEASGTILVDGVEIPLPMYQCDECLVNVELAGETVELALTFCVGTDGKPFDPAAPDGKLRF